MDTDARLGQLQADLTLLKSRIDCPSHLYDELIAERQSASYRLRYDAATHPLVSICTATYNRAELLCERALRSLVQQTYKNLEIIVVGDGCTDDTEERVAAIRDNRIRFINLPERGRYPDEAHRRWCVAGTIPMNAALAIATGEFVTHLDDDDQHAPDRIEKLLNHCRKERAEVVHHPFAFQRRDESWLVNQSAHFELGQVTTSSVFYDSFFARIPWDLNAHLLGEPGDWNRLRKFAYLGARISRHPDILLEHFMEQSQRS